MLHRLIFIMELPDQPEVFASQTAIKIEKYTDDQDSYLDIQTIAGNKNQEIRHDFPSEPVSEEIPISKTARFKSSKSDQQTCNICKKFFSKPKYLQKHMVYHRDKRHSCDICERSFIFPAHLRYHKRIHTGEKPYKCYFCERKFTFLGSLSSHTRIHTGERPYKCKSCGKSFAHSSSLKTHSKTHTGEKPYKCEICEKRFTRPRHVIYHMRIHTGEKPYECDLCGMSFTVLCTLKTHLRAHIGIKALTCVKANEINTMDPEDKQGDQVVVSEIKPKGMIRRSKRISSMTISLNQKSTVKRDIAETNTETIEQADEIERQTGSDSRMIIRSNTIRRKSSSENNNNATEDLEFKSSGDNSSKAQITGIIHRLKQIDNAAVSINQTVTRKCEIAETRIVSIDQGNETKKQTDLGLIMPSPKIEKCIFSEQTKIETEDPKVKPCDRKVGNKVKFKGLTHRSKKIDNATNSMELSSTLEYDTNQTVLGQDESPVSKTVRFKSSKSDQYICNICSKSYSKLIYLKKHMVFHRDKHHHCDTCERSFTLPAHLRNHKRLHTGEKPYKCDFCDRKFTQSSSLSSHMRLHTGDRPYKCKSCGKSFTQIGNLKRHSKTHTGEKLYKCKTCKKRFTQSSSLTDHMRIHTGDKPYECGLCSKSFRQRSTLKTHLRTHIGN